jgi:mitogen-activated protein kinase kinase kinase 13
LTVKNEPEVKLQGGEINSNITDDYNYTNSSSNSSYGYFASKNIFSGLFGCIKPIINMWSFKTTNFKSNLKKNGFNDWGNEHLEIPFESFRDLQWLGSGAQGCVFKASLNGEEVAIKKVKSREEANIKHLRRLNHANLVKFKGVSLNDEKKFFCIIMEYCAYGQLFTHLGKLGHDKLFLKPSLMINWLKQIANGMHYLHMHKMIHRDLKSPKYVFFLF